MALPIEIASNARNPMAPLDERANAICASLLSAEERRIFSRVVQTIDRDAYEAARRRHDVERQFANRPSHPVKYFDVAHYIARDIPIAIRLGLHTSPPITVLDIGAGPCIFGAICKALGHTYVASDVLSKDTPVLSDVAALFGFERLECKVSAYEPVPIAGRYNLIVAHRAMFDLFSVAEARVNDGRAFWGTKEWDFFVKDVTTRLLAPSGRLHVWLNPQTHRDGVTRNPEEILTAFAGAQATVNSKRIAILVGPPAALPDRSVGSSLVQRGLSLAHSAALTARKWIGG